MGAGKYKGKIFTISNWLSFMRVLLVVPIVYYLSDNTAANNLIAVGLMFVAALTDFLDGYLARKLNQKTDLGRIIDPIADKIGVGLIAIMLAYSHGLPVWFLLAILGRDLAILICGYFLISKTKLIPESNWSGKIAVSIIAMALIAFTLSIDAIKWYLLYLALAFLFYSTLSYFKRFIFTLRN